MIEATRLNDWSRGWRGPWLAALVALLAALPGALMAPPLDRDESRFAQATAQMLETGDFVDIRFQDEPRDKKPVGIHWLQAASVSLVSSAEARAIWAYRIPSLLGAMLAAAACAWGAAVFWGPARGLAAGALFGCTFMLATEGGIAKTDAVLCGAVTLSLAALARLYAESRGVEGAGAGWRTRLCFWAGMSLALLDKGPIGPMVALLTGLSLWASDRRAPWAGRMAWGWGLILAAAVVGPWAVAISIKTDGAFWGHAIGSDVAPKLRGGQEGHGAPPGAHLLFSPLLLFPFSALLPAALFRGWKARAEPAVRFALCWLIPSWLVFEAAPTKLPHYTLPLFGALAWLILAVVGKRLSRAEHWIGLGLSLLAGALLAGVAIYAQISFGDRTTLGWCAAVVGLMGLAAIAGGVLMTSPWPWPMFAAACALGVAAHGMMIAGLAPRLDALWMTPRIVRLLDQTHFNPRDGLVEGPVMVLGYAEPSLVFSLGTETEFGDAGDGAEALSQGRPVLVEGRADRAFQDELAADHLKAAVVGQTSGFDYSSGKRDRIVLYRADPLAPRPAPVDARPSLGTKP